MAWKLPLFLIWGATLVFLSWFGLWTLHAGARPWSSEFVHNCMRLWTAITLVLCPLAWVFLPVDIDSPPRARHVGTVVALPVVAAVGLGWGALIETATTWFFVSLAGLVALVAKRAVVDRLGLILVAAGILALSLAALSR